MTKEQLREFRDLNRERRQLYEQLCEMEARIYEPRGQRFSSTPGSSHGNGGTMDDLIAVHIKLQDRYERKLATVERMQLQIEDAIEGLPALQRMIIRYRYIDLLRWEDICDSIPLSWSHVHRCHSEALVALADK